jgi:hypothetical protein
VLHVLLHQAKATSASERKRLADELKIERAGRQRAEELLVKQVRSACRNMTRSILWLVLYGAAPQVLQEIMVIGASCTRTLHQCGASKKSTKCSINK